MQVWYDDNRYTNTYNQPWLVIGNDLKVEFKVDSYGGRKNRGRNDDEVYKPGWGLKLKIYPVYDGEVNVISNEIEIDGIYERLETKIMILMK